MAKGDWLLIKGQQPVTVRARAQRQRDNKGLVGLWYEAVAPDDWRSPSWGRRRAYPAPP